MRPRRGHARLHGPALRPRARRPGLLGHHRGLHPGRHHRHRGRPGDRHGDDLAARDDALQLQHALRHRRAGRLGHHHPARAALAGADRHGRPARPLGGRHVQGRVGSRHPAGADLRDLHLPAGPHPPRIRARPAQIGAHAARLGPLGQMPAWHHPLGHPDLRGARLHGRPAVHGPRHRHAHRGGRHGRRGLADPRGHPQAADVEAHQRKPWTAPCASPPWWCSS